MRALLALDLLDPNLEPLMAEAIRHATQMDATLDLLYIEPVAYLVGYISDPSVAHMLELETQALHKAHKDRLDEWLESLPEAIRGKVVIEQGGATELLIVEAASSYDMLFIGTHGRTGLKHFMLGSVAERVIRKATVPTLVLRVNQAD